MTAYCLPFSESDNIIYIFHVIRYHVPNFLSRVSKRIDSKIFRIYISPSKVNLRS